MNENIFYNRCANMLCGENPPPSDRYALRHTRERRQVLTCGDFLIKFPIPVKIGSFRFYMSGIGIGYRDEFNRAMHDFDSTASPLPSDYRHLPVLPCSVSSRLLLYDSVKLTPGSRTCMLYLLMQVSNKYILNFL